MPSNCLYETWHPEVQVFTHILLSPHIERPALNPFVLCGKKKGMWLYWYISRTLSCDFSHILASLRCSPPQHFSACQVRREASHPGRERAQSLQRITMRPSKLSFPGHCCSTVAHTASCLKSLTTHLKWSIIAYSAYSLGPFSWTSPLRCHTTPAVIHLSLWLSYSCSGPLEKLCIRKAGYFHWCSIEIHHWNPFISSYNPGWWAIKAQQPVIDSEGETFSTCEGKKKSKLSVCVLVVYL